MCWLSRVAFTATTLWLFGASLALADARVDVEVKDASGRLATGQVTLSAGSLTRSCATVGGRCSITAPAGTYQVRLVPANGATSTSHVTVPASGSIRLSLRITPATAPAPTPAPTPTPTITTATTVGRDKPAPTATPKPDGATTRTLGVNPSTPALRDVGRGSRLRVQGSVTDASGRLTNATISLEQSGRVIGRAKCVGGRFSMFDLNPGTYTVVAVGKNGARVRLQLAVRNVLLRPTLRLPAR